MYANAVNTFRILCPDGTYREPCPLEVSATVKQCAHVSLTGETYKTSPELRAAERNGDLWGAVKHRRRIIAEASVEIVAPSL